MCHGAAFILFIKMSFLLLFFLIQTVNCQLDWEIDIPEWQQDWRERNYIPTTKINFLTYQPTPKKTIKPTYSPKLLSILTDRPKPNKHPTTQLFNVSHFSPSGPTNKPISSDGHFSFQHNSTLPLKRSKMASIVAPILPSKNNIIPCNNFFLFHFIF